ISGSLTNLSGGTLTGGTYQVVNTGSGASIQLPSGITTNAATILLDGTNTNLYVGGGGIDALNGFVTNAATGSFTIQNGRNFTSAGSFSNSGGVTIGSV